MRIWNWATGLARVRQMRLECFGHPRLDLRARQPQREDAVDVRTVGTPGTVFSLLVDDEVVLQRRSRSPVARRIAASVPTGNRIGVLAHNRHDACTISALPHLMRTV